MQRFNTYQTAPVPSGGSDWQAECTYNTDIILLSKNHFC